MFIVIIIITKGRILNLFTAMSYQVDSHSFKRYVTKYL